MNKIPAPTAPQAKLNWVQTSTDRPETIVFIHGVGHDLTYWDRQIEAMRGDYNVVAFDLPGHGRSPGVSKDWSFEYAAGIVSGLIERIGTKPVHLVGISFGGMIAQVTSIGRPDLVSSLILIGTASRFPEEVRRVMRSRAETVRMDGMSAIVQSSLERWFTTTTRTERPDIVDRLTKTLLADDALTHAAIWDVISTLDIHSRLGEISCPTLVLVGEHDPITPPSVADDLSEAIRGAKMEVIAKASHMVTIEAPTAVNDALKRFLEAL